MVVAGHLFIINGDLTKVACDALLIPTDPTVYFEPQWRALLASRDHAKPTRWARGVVFLSAQEKTPHVWLGNIGQQYNNFDYNVFAPTVETFVTEAITRLAQLPDTERISPWPRKRLAINVVGSGQGGGRLKKGHLSLGLVRQLTGLAAAHDVDIVLVTYGETAYAAAQRARLQVLGDDADLGTHWQFHTRTNGEVIRHAKDLAAEARRNQLVLFIGAGVSAGVGLPSWQQLLLEGAARAGFDADQRELLQKMDNRDQATLIDRRLRDSPVAHGDEGNRFKAAVAETLSAPTPYSLAHGLLASLPSKEAVTTNFDALFEQACRIGGTDLAVLPENPRTTDGRWLLKLHGSVDDPENMVLTRSDYLDMPRRYGALMGLVQGLLMLRKMVFVGYSLSDEDFHELVDEVRAARRGATEITKGTVLSLFEDTLHQQLWAADLEVVPMIVGPFDAADPAEVALAARELDLFLDLVGYLSTTSASFFLDPDYDDLSAGEKRLRKALTDLASYTNEHPQGPIGELVKEFLRQFGADQTS